MIVKNLYLYLAYGILFNFFFFSFQVRHSYIEYLIKAKYKTLWQPDLKATETFSVQHSLISTAFPNSMNSICDTKDRSHTGCWSQCYWYKSDPLRVTTIIPKNTYTVGKSIPITVQIDNSSDVSVMYTDLKIVEELTFMLNK